MELVNGEVDHPAERVRWVIDKYYDGHPKRLADALGAAPATFTQILKKGAFPSWKIYTGILRLHNQINPDWFLHGKEPALRLADTESLRSFEKKLKLIRLVECLGKELNEFYES